MRISTGVFAVLSHLAASSAMAQTASEVTPESFQPQLQKLSGSVAFTGQVGTKAPPGAERIGVTLSGVSLEGGFPEMAAANDRLEKRLTRGRIPVSELFDATAQLEAAYAEAGFVLARVILPQQSLRDGGRLRVAVVDGFVEAVDVSQAPEEVRGRIETLTDPLVDKRRMTLEELERQLLLAGDTPGVALRSALATGKRPGGTIIALDPEYQNYTGFVGLDNFAPKALGDMTFSAGFEANSVLGYGETLYGRISAAPSQIFSADPNYRILAFGALVPVGPSGLAFNVEYTMSDTTPSNAAVPTRSDFERLSLRASYPWVRSRKMSVNSQLILDLSRDRQALVAGDVSVFEDKVAALRAATSLSYTHNDGAQTNGSLVLSQGLSGFGARTGDEVGSGTPLSRAGADAVFTKLTGSIAHQRALTEEISLSVQGRFQASFGDPLLTSEMFSIVGPGELSTFDSGDLRGDSGWVLRAEVSRPQLLDLQDRKIIASPYLFAGAGEVRLQNPTAVEAASEGARAYGVGVDIFSQGDTSFRSRSMRLEYGTGDRDNAPDDTRFSISGSFRF